MHWVLANAGRFIIGGVIAAASAAGSAWFMADFITDKYAAGFTTAIEGLTTQVTDVSSRLQDESTVLRSERDSLAADIAERIRASDAAQDRQVDNVSSDLQALTAQLRETTAAIANLSGSVEGLGKNIATLDDRLVRSEARQVEFERYVISVLLQSSPPTAKTATEIQANWGVGKDVLNYTYTGDSTSQPLANWAKYVGSN